MLGKMIPAVSGKHDGVVAASPQEHVRYADCRRDIFHVNSVTVVQWYIPPNQSFRKA